MTSNISYNPSARTPTRSGTSVPDTQAATEKIRIPTNVREVTTDWLNAALAPHLDGHVVVQSHAEPFSDPGQTADVVDVRLSYDSDACPLPTRMIAKLAASDPETRDMCRIFKHYERETGFYKSYESDGLPIVKCFHADHDPATMNMVILMEHLAPSYSPGYAISVDQIRLAVREVALLHARWWNDDSLKRQPALVQLDDEDHWLNVMEGGLKSCETVRRIMGDDCEISIAAMVAFSANFDAVLAHVQARPFALQHCDYHAKQLFFPKEGEGRFAIIDWQFSVAGPAAWDIARLVNLGLDSATRSEVEDGLVAEYLDLLAANGVEDYGHENFMTDYKFGVFLTQLINFIAVSETDKALLDRECAECGLDWKEVWLMRGERMMRELDVPGFLRSL